MRIELYFPYKNLRNTVFTDHPWRNFTCTTIREFLSSHLLSSHRAASCRARLAPGFDTRHPERFWILTIAVLRAGRVQIRSGLIRPEDMGDRPGRPTEREIRP